MTASATVIQMYCLEFDMHLPFLGGFDRHILSLILLHTVSIALGIFFSFLFFLFLILAYCLWVHFCTA
jgi:hypothetical protein